MADIASQGECFVNIAGIGLLKLERVKSVDIKDDASAEVVTAMGLYRGAGWRHKQGGFQIDLEVYEEVGTDPEVDWYVVLNSKATFTFSTREEGDSFTYSYLSRVSKIDRKKDSDGNFMQTVSLAATTVDRT